MPCSSCFFLVTVLALPVARSGEVSPFAGLQQEWAWDDLQSFKQQVKDGIKKQSDKLTDGIRDYKEAAVDYGKALRDETFRKAVRATGVCKFLPEKDDEEELYYYIDDDYSDEDKDMAFKMSAVKTDPSVDPAACEAVASETAAVEIKSKMKDFNSSGTVDQLMKLLTERTSASLCEGKHGIKEWLQNKSKLRESHPEEYKEELRKELKGRLNPALGHYSSKFCEEKPKAVRLFQLAKIHALGGGGSLPSSALAVPALGFAALLAMVTRRRPSVGPQEALQALESDNEALLAA